MNDGPTRMDTRGSLARSAGALLSGTLVAIAVTVTPAPAAADFRLCNNTTSRVGIAIGYREDDGWTTEGWWNLSPRSCETLMRGAPVGRYYYIHAVDYDRSGEWSGQAFMCTRDKGFTIRGTEDCLARGFDRTGFFEVDTGEQPDWTVQLTDTGATPYQRQRFSEPSSLTAPEGFTRNPGLGGR
jgi:uncharacterized membrane protein